MPHPGRSTAAMVGTHMQRIARAGTSTIVKPRSGQAGAQVPIRWCFRERRAGEDVMLIGELRKARPWPQRPIAVGLTFIALSVVGPVLAGVVNPSVTQRSFALAAPALVAGLAMASSARWPHAADRQASSRLRTRHAAVAVYDGGPRALCSSERAHLAAIAGRS